MWWNIVNGFPKRLVELSNFLRRPNGKRQPGAPTDENIPGGITIPIIKVNGMPIMRPMTVGKNEEKMDLNLRLRWAHILKVPLLMDCWIWQGTFGSGVMIGMIPNILKILQNRIPLVLESAPAAWCAAAVGTAAPGPALLRSRQRQALRSRRRRWLPPLPGQLTFFLLPFYPLPRAARPSAPSPTHVNLQKR